jgi:hypothetical protein
MSTRPNSHRELSYIHSMRKHQLLACIATCGALTACGGGGPAASPSVPPAGATASPATTRPVFSDATTSSEAVDVTNQPGASNQPGISVDPNVADPSGADPGVTDPDVIDPNVVDPNVVDRDVNDPSSPAPIDPTPLDPEDDVPVCDAFETFYDHFTQVVLVATFAADTDDSGDTTVEQYEVVRYLDLGNDLTALRQQLPSPVVGTFDPIFKRIESAPKLMAAAGFSTSELDGLTAKVNASQPPDTALPNDPRLKTAAQALIAEFGPFLDVLELVETIGDDDETNGTAWLTTNCPGLSDLIDA